MMFIDAHCHIDLYERPLEVVDEGTLAGVGMVAVTNAPFVFNACRQQLCDRKNVWTAVGLHPELVGEYSHQVEDLVQQLADTRFVGEVGLDYRATDSATHRLQRDVFVRIVDACRERGNTVMTIHSRGAESDVVSIIGVQFNGTAILHWYSGAVRHLDTAQANGSYFSINASMLASKNGRKLIGRMDRSRVLTESDGPFAKVNGRRARPSDVPDTVGALASLWGVETEVAALQVIQNWESATRTADGAKCQVE